MYKRKNGIFYTPDEVSLRLVNFLSSNVILNKNTQILEPSCGEGSFVKALLSHSESAKITAVEKNKSTYEKIKSQYIVNKCVKIYNADFIKYSVTDNKKYDVIIGNPPYVQSKNMSQTQKNSNKKAFQALNEENYKVENLWELFVTRSINLLNKDGALCFIIPAEMMQVKYASDLRDKLADQFKFIEIATFDTNIFSQLQQNVIVLFAYKKHRRSGIRFLKFSTGEGNKWKYKVISSYKKIPTGSKWLQFRLSEAELKFIRSFEGKVSKSSDYCKLAAGIVTGANDFFLKNDEQIKTKKLRKYTAPIIQKGTNVGDTICFTKQDFNKLKTDGDRCFLLNFSKLKKPSIDVKKYLNSGLNKGIHLGYKCQTRDPWYVVPNIKKGEGYFFKRIHKIPKLIRNDSGSFATDTAYRLEMKDDYDISSFIFSFYNSITLIYGELYGRSYGGGVLEITPNEFRSLPIPYVKISKSLFRRADQMIRSEKNSDIFLDFIDSYVLSKHMKIAKRDILKLQQIRKKLIASRVAP